MVEIRSRTIGIERIDSATHHTQIIGWSGKGKDMFGEFYITQKIGHCKVIDFYSVERNEGFFYSIKNSNPFFIRKGKYLTGGNYEPTAFESEIIMICGEKLNKVQKLPKNVKIRSLNLEDIKNEKMIPYVSTTESGDGLLEMIFYFCKILKLELNIIQLKHFLTLMINKELPEYLNEMFKGISRQTIFTILRNIISLENSGMFSDAYPKLNFEELVTDTNKITVISYNLLTSDLQVATALGMISEMIRDKREFTQGKSLVQILIYFRELQSLYNKENQVFYRNCDTIRKNISFFLTEGRDNKITLVANSQSFSQIPIGIWKHFQKVFGFGMSKVDAEKLLLYADIDFNTMNKIPKLGKGQGIYVANGEYRYLMEVIPTMHLKKEGGMNVLDYLARKYGSFEVSYQNKINDYRKYIELLNQSLINIPSSSLIGGGNIGET